MRRSPLLLLLLLPSLLLLCPLLTGCDLSCGSDRTATTQPADTTAAVVAQTTSTAATAPAPSTTVPEPTTGHPPISHPEPGTTVSTGTTSTTTPPEPPADETTTTTLAVSRPTSTVVAMPLDRWTRFEETDSHIGWMGSWWTTLYDAAASGGSYKRTDYSGTCYLQFEGTRIAFIAGKHFMNGKARVKLVGEGAVLLAETIDLYRDPWDFASERVWTSPVLPRGQYHLSVGWTEERRDEASGFRITVDAFDVMGTLLEPVAP